MCSCSTNFSSDDNNRTWNLGIGYASDRIGSTNDPTLHETRRTAEQIRENMKALDVVPKLGADVLARIDAIVGTAAS